VPYYLVDIVQSLLVLAFVVPSVVVGIVRRRQLDRRAAASTEQGASAVEVAA
jgi:hypothetical protein